MTPNRYQEQAARTLIPRPPRDYSDHEVMVLWLASGISGEAGEIMEHVKKGVFHDHGINRGKLIEELGDELWYIAGMATQIGVTLQEVMDHNIQKLRGRYPEGFDTERSKHREG